MPAYYSNTLKAFAEERIKEIIGCLTQASSRAGYGPLELAQIEAWNNEIAVLRAALLQVLCELPSSVHWGVLLEYPLIRLGKRIDVVLLARDVIFVIEFKSSAT